MKYYIKKIGLSYYIFIKDGFLYYMDNGINYSSTKQRALRYFQEAQNNPHYLGLYGCAYSSLNWTKFFPHLDKYIKGMI